MEKIALIIISWIVLNKYGINLTHFKCFYYAIRDPFTYEDGEKTDKIFMLFHFFYFNISLLLYWMVMELGVFK